MLLNKSFQKLFTRQYSSWNDNVRQGVLESIGKTPLIELKTLSAQTGCTIVGKGEFMNPAGGVKDRAAKWIIQEGERERGENPRTLNKRGVIVEGTAGNTGLGLSIVGLALNYRTIIYVPNKIAKEKMDGLRQLGADLRPVPVVPYSNPEMYQHQAAREAKRLEAQGEFVIHGNQFDNIHNRLAHQESTAPEIVHQLGGIDRLDGFVCATGTGGTLGGVSRFFKSRSDRVKIWLADPPGSCLFNYVKFGKMEREGDGSITEGIGNGRVTENLKDTQIDDALLIPDKDSIRMVYELLANEGLFVGASTALNVCAAVEMAKQLGPGHTIATILCDSASRYASRLFSRQWLEEKQLLSAIPQKYHCFMSSRD